MNRTRLWILGAATLSLASAVYALQEGTRFPGERQATTSVVVDPVEGDEIVLSYNTLQFGPQVVSMMMGASGPDREQYAAFIPRRLRATFTTDVALQFGDTKLAAGKYGLTFLPADGEEGGLAMRFLSEQQTAAEVKVEKVDGGDEFRFLNFNLRSKGVESFLLQMDYGSVKGNIAFEVASDDDEEEDG